MNNRIAELRKELRIRQQELADILETNRITVSHWEQGNREIPSDMLVKMSDYFNVSVDYLLGRTKVRNFGDNAQFQSDERLLETVTEDLNGLPVFSKKMGWLLVNYPDGVCYDMRGLKHPIEKVGRVYINSPDGHLNHIRFDKPIDVEELPKLVGRTVWVEPLSDDFKINALIRGWFRLEDGYATNDFGYRLYFATYGNQWNAYSDVQ